MGSWHGTCAVSNLPITYRDPVVLIMLIENQSQYPDRCSGDGFTGSCHYAMPMLLPVRGLYDDQGGIEEIEPCVSVDQITAQLNAADALVASGGRPTDLIGWLNAIKTNKITAKVDHFIPKKRRMAKPDELRASGVGYMLVHRRIYDALVDEAFTGDSYVGKFFRVLWERDKAEMDKRIADLRGRYTQYGIDGSDDPSLGLSPFGVDLRGIFPETERWHTFGLQPRTSDLREFCAFHYAFGELRRSYIIQSGAGSQDTHYEFQKTIHALCAQIIEDKHKQWAE